MGLGCGVVLPASKVLRSEQGQVRCEGSIPKRGHYALCWRASAVLDESSC